ncbi:MAG: lamin tail domain-containing protein [Bacteroidales bacterium]|nr:lamin tail domain-containing protein [Bacteroidales bacterium]MCF8334815.1 lamin tail domain-containing protein [Bacteroidales bacterium]
MKYIVTSLCCLVLLSLFGQSQNIVINEIMYNDDNSDIEWVELYNRSNDFVDISGWHIIDNDPNHQPVMIPENTTLSEGEYYTVVVDGGPYIPFDADQVETGLFGLSNGGDEVNLYNRQQLSVDKVVYYDQAPWPEAADGDGYTLELADVNSDNNDPDNWKAGLLHGGTPNTENSVKITNPYIRLIYPNGTEYIEKGVSHTITWGVLNYDGNVSLKLISHENDVEKVIASGLETTSYEWEPDSALPDGDDYYIRISGENGQPWDDSDRTFNIVSQQDPRSIAITEIMYHPPGGTNDSLEYLELYNNEDSEVNLEGYYFSEGVNYEFGDIDFPSHSYLLLAINARALEALIGQEVLQWSGGRLNNGGESLELRDKYHNVIDKVTYKDRFPWDSLTDGYGPSLTMCEPLADNALPGNWNASTNRFYTLADGTPLYGTPGAGCDFSGTEDVSTKISARVYPNPVRKKLTVEMERGSYKVSVYTLMGRKVQEDTIKGKKLKIDFSDLQAGIFVVEVINIHHQNRQQYFKVEHL